MDNSERNNIFDRNNNVQVHEILSTETIYRMHGADLERLFSGITEYFDGIQMIFGTNSRTSLQLKTVMQLANHGPYSEHWKKALSEHVFNK